MVGSSTACGVGTVCQSAEDPLALDAAGASSGKRFDRPMKASGRRAGPYVAYVAGIYAIHGGAASLDDPGRPGPALTSSLESGPAFA